MFPSVLGVATCAFAESNSSYLPVAGVFKGDRARSGAINPLSESRRSRTLLASLFATAARRLTPSMKPTTKQSKQANETSVRVQAESLGIDARILGRAVRRKPILRSKLGALATNTGVCARLLGVKHSLFVRMALIEPDLIDVPVAALLANIREGAQQLRVSPDRFKQLSLKAPVLLTLTPQEWKSRISRLARTMNCEEEQVCRLIVRVPEIVGWPISRWRQKRREIGAALGLDTRQMNLMIRRYPDIINSSAATLKTHAKRLARILPLSGPELASVLVRLPTLLRVTPDLLASKLPKLKAIGLLYDGKSAREIIMMLPAALGYSHQRLKQRRELALIATPRPGLSRLLTMSPKEAEYQLPRKTRALPRRRSVHRF